MATFESMLADLAASGVRFIVVGGLAVAHAGFVRATDDLDILVDTEKSNLEKLIGVLSGFGDGHAQELTPDDFPLEEGCVRIAETFDIDVFTIMNGLTYQDLQTETTGRDVGDEVIAFLTAEALLGLKQESLRPKDQMDALMLRKIISQGRS